VDIVDGRVAAGRDQLVDPDIAAVGGNVVAGPINRDATRAKIGYAPAEWDTRA
jgi:hypothetical protein